MILVDTSVWIDFFSDSRKPADLVNGLLEANQVAICGPVLTEIYRGFRSEKERERVIPLFEGCRTLSQPTDLWAEAGELGFLLKRKGRKVKTMDLLVSCYALSYQIPLLTSDSDFRKIKAAGVPLLLYF